ncbi:MAG TPA: TMEM175 family protein [Polyangia bacterium]|nr:TMEM175 family protein [Polyangia bacterium]
MSKGRLEAFSDGVIAILITIMVLELKVPHGAEWSSLKPMIPVLLSYLLSFVIVGIYWNNHHHLLHAAERISGKILWANLHLLFWLSLFPFVTNWLGESHFATVPVAAYGVVMLLAGVGYKILQDILVAHHGAHSKLAAAIGSDTKGRASAALYAVAVGAAFVNRWISCGIYVFVALMWLVPDKRIEKKLE